MEKKEQYEGGRCDIEGEENEGGREEGERRERGLKASWKP